MKLRDHVKEVKRLQETHIRQVQQLTRVSVRRLHQARPGPGAGDRRRAGRRGAADCVGSARRSRWGGAYHYIKSYTKAKDGEGLLREIMHVTGRMAAAVKHILDEAEALRLAQISTLELCPPG